MRGLQASTGRSLQPAHCLLPTSPGSQRTAGTPATSNTWSQMQVPSGTRHTSPRGTSPTSDLCTGGMRRASTSYLHDNCGDCQIQHPPWCGLCQTPMHVWHTFPTQILAFRSMQDWLSAGDMLQNLIWLQIRLGRPQSWLQFGSSTHFVRKSGNMSPQKRCLTHSYQASVQSSRQTSCAG